MAEEIISENGLSDRITVIQKKIEDVELDVDCPQVDIIISEWMGFCLLYESMFDSVICGRDKLLKEGGLMFPDRARIYIAGMDDIGYKSKSDKLWLDNDYGIKMSCIQQKMESFVYVDVIPPDFIVTS